MKSSSQGKLDGVKSTDLRSSKLPRLQLSLQLSTVSAKNVGQALCLGEEAEAGRDSKTWSRFFAGSVGGVWFG